MYDGKKFIITIYTVLKHHYPDFENLLNQVPDHRKRCTYEVAEILMTGLSMFIFKRESRNNADQGVRGEYEKNYQTLFGMKLPIMDTVDNFLKELAPQELDHLKQLLVQKLVEKKVLQKWKFRGNFLVACDGTGIFSFTKEPFEGCPFKVGSRGKKTFHASVLEAKIVTPNGFSISIASQWLSNSEDMTDKQDCELKAFARLALKIKKMFPRLPITILADSLYPNDTFFKICQENDWNHILTLKEGSLKSVWVEIGLLYPLLEKENKNVDILKKESKGWLHRSIMFVNNIAYKKQLLNWIECQYWYDNQETHTRFVHITDLEIDQHNVLNTSQNGRLRWGIENEGFNTQKNEKYNMQHKYARKHLGAMKNYYNLLQIAHIIHQLTQKLLKIKELIKISGTTLQALYEDMFAKFKDLIITNHQIQFEISTTKQLRY